MSLVGIATPRLSTQPLRPLNEKTSRGFSVARFADEVLGQPLLPWQRELMVRALEVNPDGTYRFRTVLCLVGRQSGKTTALKTLALWRMYIDGARLVVGSAQSLAISKESWAGAIELAQSAPSLAREIATVRLANGEQELRLTSGARYVLAATRRGSGRGLSADLLIMDELREQRDWAAWSSLSKTTVARPKGQIWAISNAGDDGSTVLNSLRERALGGHDESLGIFEWSAPDGAALDDTDAWRQSCPGLGHTVSESGIRSALATDPPAVFRTEILCQRVTSIDGAIDVGAWSDCRDPSSTLEPYRDRLAACVDVSPSDAHVTLSVAATLPDGRVRVEVAGAWTSTAEARTELPVLLDRLKPAMLAWYPTGPGAALASILRPRKGSTEITGAKVAEVCQTFADLVLARRLLHAGDDLLTAHVAGASKLPSGDGWRFSRPRSQGGNVDAAYSAAGAVHAAQNMPARRVPFGRLIPERSTA